MMLSRFRDFCLSLSIHWHAAGQPSLSQVPWQKPAGRTRNIYPCILSFIHSFSDIFRPFTGAVIPTKPTGRTRNKKNSSSGIFRPFRAAAISRSASSILLLTDVAAIVDDVPSSMNVATWDCNRVRAGEDEGRVEGASSPFRPSLWSRVLGAIVVPEFLAHLNPPLVDCSTLHFRWVARWFAASPHFFQAFPFRFWSRIAQDWASFWPNPWLLLFLFFFCWFFGFF